MTPVSYYVATEQTSPAFAYDFARGCGGTITPDIEGGLFPGPVALFGSPPAWPILRQAKAEGRDWYYADHAYIGRGKFYRITKNAYQHDGRGPARPDRFRMFNRPVKPWQKNGKHVLICPQSSAYFELHGMSQALWLTEVMDELRNHTDRELRVRWKNELRTRPIGLDLLDAWACVVFSSASALDALIAGVPVFTLAPFAASVRMGLSDLSKIEEPARPDGREPFLWNLSYQQWTRKEIMTGEAWKSLQYQPEINLAA